MAVTQISKRCVWALICLLGTIFYSSSEAQRGPIFSRISVKEGLSNVAIKDIYEDNQGVIWFCTEDGLNRYDGYEFKIHRHIRGHSNSIGENYVNTIVQDGNDIFWIGTRNSGLVRFDPSTENFTHFVQDKTDPLSIASNQILALAIGPENEIWVGTAGAGLSIYDQEAGNFQNYRPYPGESDQNNTILDIEIDRDKAWILTGKRLIQFNLISKKFNPDAITPIEISIGQNSLFEVNFDLKGNLWFGSEEGAVRYDTTRKTYDIYNPLEELGMTDRYGEIFEIIQTADSVYWFGTDNGLVRFKENENSFERINTSPYIEEAFHEEPINKLIQDKHGLLWIGTQHFGIVKSNLRLPEFIHYSTDKNSEVVLPNNVIRSLLYDSKNIIWVGSVTGDLVRIFPDGSSKVGNYFNNSISCIYENSKGEYLIGTWLNGLYKMGSEYSESFEKINFSPSSTDEVNIIQIVVEDRFGNYFIGTEYGLSLYNPESKQAREFLIDSDNEGVYNSVQSNSIVHDVYGNIWVGTYNGLFKMTPKDTSVNSIEADYGIKLYDVELEDNRVTSLAYDSTIPNQLIVGTFSDGIKILEFNSLDLAISVETFNEGRGLSSNVVYGIEKDASGNIWASTHFGLSKLDVYTEEFANYYKSDGLQDNQFFWGAAAKGANDNLLFGGINGFNLIKADQLTRDTTTATVLLTKLLIYNQPIEVGDTIGHRYVLEKNIDYLDELVLPHWQNMFTIEFRSPHYVMPELNKYAYRILGFRDDWIYVDSDKSFITMTNLDPGNYLLEVKAANYQGVWNSTPTQLSIKIKAPWWNNPYAKGIGFFMVIVFIILAVRLRIKYLEASKVKLTRIVNKKTNEIKDKHNEILDKNESLRKLNIKLQDSLEDKLKIIKQLKIAQSRLIESEKMASIGVLTAGLAHELNNPLSYIGGVVDPIKMDLNEIKLSLPEDIIKKHQEEIEEIEILLEGMTTGVAKASDIIKNLMQITPNGNISVNSVFNLNELIESTAKLIQKSNPEIAINVAHGKSLEFFGSKVEMNQVFLNIIKNACEAIEDTKMGKVDICSYTEDQQAIIEITDNGTGISKEALNQIFEPFYTTKIPGKGTGLGLYISYSVIKKHNGDIKVESYPGNGTKFILTLPIFDPEKGEPQLREEFYE